MTIVQLNQEAFFAVSDYITNSIQIPTLIKNMQSAVDYQASKGIGMIHTDRLKNLKVEKLILSGEEYRPQSGSVAGTVLRGLFSSAKA